MTHPIAIVGAGLGGLAAALALQRAGFGVRVYEQAAELGEVGAGISLCTGSVRGLAALGVGPQLLNASMPVANVAFLHYRTQALLAGVLDGGTPVDLGLDTARHIHRADLHAILLAAVRALDPDAVLTGRNLVSVEQDGAAVTLRFADGGTARADMLVAADGARSAVRRLLFEPSPPDFAGQVAFRCLVPREIAAPFMKAGNAAVSVGPARVFNRYVIRGGRTVNVVGIAQCDLWRNEGWSTRATVAEFAAEFSEFHADVRGLIGCAPADTLIKWGLFARPPIANWSVGRVVLLGDAAHPITPFLGLGAALAIEDGIVLARTLSAQLPAGARTNTAAIAAAFAAFQRAREWRVDEVRDASLHQGRIVQTTDPDSTGLIHSPSQNKRLFEYDPNEDFHATPIPTSGTAALHG
jgi:salicylate hydroxylase